MRVYESAANAHDLDAILKLIAGDAIFLFSDGTAHSGKEAIRLRSAYIFSSGWESSEENRLAERAVAPQSCAGWMGIGV